MCQSVAGISITSQFHEFQNISVEESGGCQYDSIVISNTKDLYDFRFRFEYQKFVNLLQA
jgi:hypothetical protein